MKTGKMVPYLFVTAPILESYVRMCIPPLYRKPGKRVAVEVDGTIDSILVWDVVCLLQQTESDDDLEDQLWKLGQMSLISAVLGELFVEQCVC
jgi:hypothetical protein